MGKIGVYIGSFNPVHKSHKYLVNDMIDNHLVDKLIVIPTGDKYHLKSGLEKFVDRYNMLKLAIGNKAIISEIEKEKYHYTYENIMILKEQYKNDDLYLVIGADNLIELHTWKNYEYLLNNCYFIVYSRNGINVSDHINNSFTNYKNKFIIRENNGELSSTYIRNKLSNNEEPNDCLDEKVLEYIKKHNLYNWRG